MKNSVDIQGLVLSNQEYKDNDAIVTLLTQEGVMKIYARGVLKSTSKNRRICQPFSLVEYTIQQRSNGFDLLMSGHLKEYYYKIQEDLVSQSVCFVLRDCIVHLQQNEKVYDHLLHTWQALHNQGQNAISFAILTLRELMRLDGIVPYISGCIRCGRTDRIETISLEDGGFVCRGCNSGQLPKYQKEEIIKIYSLFHAKDYQDEKLLETYSFSIDDLIYWARWIEHHSHLRLDSLRFLQSVA